ncbi:helix-turn-helix domain-containing protein [Streptomyces chumphonensis]|uniref:helix-turn-helix domain-containing protein n=1 Tax=Streptomyces chumphonensis TaxID=1214925 RepID=UPI003D758546
MPRTERVQSASPTFQYCADLVRTLREANGWSQEELGRRMGYTGAAISALETLKQPPTELMLTKLDEVLFDGKVVFRRAGPYLALDHLPAYFKDYALLERQALSIGSYQSMVIDGLFQTEAYARTVIKGGYPALTDDEAERYIAARVARISLFDRVDPIPHLELVQEESTLRRQYGTPAEMREQLHQVLELSSRPNVTVQILPMDQGARHEHAGTEGPMKLVEMPDNQRVAYLEAQRRGLLIREPSEVSELTQRYAMIRAQALGPYESRDLIERVAGEWR